MRQQHLIQVEETARKATSMARLPRKAREEEEVTVTKRKAEDTWLTNPYFYAKKILKKAENVIK